MHSVSATRSRLIVIKAFFVTVTRKIICTDYKGNNRETYDTAAEVMGLKVVNDIAYYVTLAPQRYYTDHLFVRISLAEIPVLWLA